MKCGAVNNLQVNHIEPVRSRNRDGSCLNHLDNLETLCRSCHVIETTRQRKAGELSPANSTPLRRPSEAYRHVVKHWSKRGKRAMRDAYVEIEVMDEEFREIVK